MMLTLKLFVLYFIIPSSIVEGGVTKKTLTSEEQVEKEFNPIDENLNLIMSPNSTYAKKMNLIGNIQGEIKKIIQRAVKAEFEVRSLLKEQGAQDLKKEMAEEWGWFELLRQQIEDYDEDNFPHPSDDDFELKKVKWNKTRLAGKSGPEEKQERRYQKFKYYLENRPNDAVKKLRSRLDEANVAVESFSNIIAKAYRLISAKIHDGYIKWPGRNLDEFFHQKDVLTAVGILLDEMGVSEKIIKKIEQKANARKKDDQLDGTKIDRK